MILIFHADLYYFCKMKLVLLFVFLLFVDIYFYFGTFSVANKLLGNQFLYKIFYLIISFFFYAGLIYMVLIYNSQTPSAQFDNSIVFSSLFFIVFISKFLGIFPLIIDDIIRFFRFLLTLFFSENQDNNDIGRLDFLKKLSLIFAASLSSALIYGITCGRYNFKRNIQSVFIRNWPQNLEGFKIIHISDLHLGSFESIDKLEEVVSIINNENADLVVFTGDLVNNYYHEAEPYVDTLKKIKSNYGKFSVLGNHDYCDYVRLKRNSKEWKNNFKNLLDLQKKAGFDLLLNASRLINIGGDNFNLVGVENWGKGNFNKDGDIDKAMKNVDVNLPTILLSHDPSHWSEIIINSGYDISLQMSGHTHGMQFGIEIPGFKWSPVKYRYNEWAGLYRKGLYQLYVNRGLGTLGYAGRVGISPDISILKIKRDI